jgi:hypothetical protein
MVKEKPWEANMGRMVRIVVGLIVGALVWALVAALLAQLMGRMGNLSADSLIQGATNSLTDTPAGAPGALIFLAAGLGIFWLIGRRGRPVAAGVFGGLLFLVATLAVWLSGQAAAIPEQVFGLFPVSQIWDEAKEIWWVRTDGFQLIGALTLLIPIVLIAGAAGGAVYGAISGAARAARRASRRPTVSFGE